MGLVEIPSLAFPTFPSLPLYISEECTREGISTSRNTFPWTNFWVYDIRGGTLDANLPYKCHQKSIFGISCISLMITYEYSTCDWSMIYQKWIFDDICMEGLQVEFFHYVNRQNKMADSLIRKSEFLTFWLHYKM